MRISAVGQHGHQLTRLAAMNCYLVREADGFTLIDTNLKNSDRRRADRFQLQPRPHAGEA